MAGMAKNGGGWRGSGWRKALWGGAVLLFLLPAVAMLFTEEVVWGPLDFAVWGAMLSAACSTFELAARASGSWLYRAAVAAAVGGAFFLVWVNLAVGIIGDEGNPANLMYAGVLAVGVAGAFAARFKPRGLSLALAATALAQLAVAAITFVARLGGSLDRPLQLWVLNGMFVALWLLSAGLFFLAARGQHE